MQLVNIYFTFVSISVIEFGGGENKTLKLALNKPSFLSIQRPFFFLTDCILYLMPHSHYCAFKNSFLIEIYLGL